MTTVSHILVDDETWCDWLACKAGQDLASKADVHLCGHRSFAAAKRDAAKLQPFFKAKVRAVKGECPNGRRA